MATRLERDVERRALGRRIAELRRAQGLSQSALAESVGVGMRYVQLVESGGGNPTFTVLLDFAEVLGIPATKLFDAPKSLAPPGRGRPAGVKETRRRRRVS